MHHSQLCHLCTVTGCQRARVSGHLLALGVHGRELFLLFCEHNRCTSCVLFIILLLRGFLLISKYNGEKEYWLIIVVGG